MQSDLIVTEKMNSESSGRLLNIEHQCRESVQYSWMEFLEAKAILKEV